MRRLATVLGKAAVVLLALLGLTNLIERVLVSAGVVKAPAEETIYRSPDGRSGIRWIVDAGERRPRAIVFSDGGFHIFEPSLFIKAGTPVFVRWTADSEAEITVTEDFALEAKPSDGFTQAGIHVVIHRLASGTPQSDPRRSKTAETIGSPRR